MNSPHSNGGITLVELCVALSVLSILAFSAISFAPSMIQHKRSDAAIKDIFHLFRLARTEAITSGSIVTMCPLDLSGRCRNAWNGPVSVFLDPDNSRSLSGSERIIRQISPPAMGQIQVAPANRRYFQFGPLGGAKGTLGNVTYCPEHLDDARHIRRVIISFSGRIRRARDKNGDGIVENSDGSSVRCR